MFGRVPSDVDAMTANTLRNSRAPSHSRLFSTYAKPSPPQWSRLNSSPPVAPCSLAHLGPTASWTAQASQEWTDRSAQDARPPKEIIVTIASANTNPDRQPSTGWQALTESVTSLFKPRVRIEISSYGGLRGIMGMEKTEAYPMPSVIGSMVETGREYVSHAWRSVCGAVRGSAAWFTGSLIPTIARSYSYMCGDTVELEGGPAAGLGGRSLPSYSAATTSTRQSLFSGNLRVRATDQTRRREEEYRGRFTYEDLLGARGYDADVLCQVMNGKFSVKKPHTWRDRKTARTENDWIEVFDVASDGSQDFDASYLLPDPSSNQYQIKSYCDRRKSSIILNKQLSERINDWVSYEQQTAGSMTG